MYHDDEPRGLFDGVPSRFSFLFGLLTGLTTVLLVGGYLVFSKLA